MDKPFQPLDPTVTSPPPVAPPGRREPPVARPNPAPARMAAPPPIDRNVARPPAGQTDALNALSGQGGAGRPIPGVETARPSVPDGLDLFLSASAPASQPQPVGGVPTGRGAEPEVFLASREPRAEHESLILAAEPIFVLVSQLKNARADADLKALRHRVAQELKRFEDAATRFGARAEDVTAARYVLCALTDETVLTTPWGSRSSWSSNSLLSELHGETWGGEKVFQILDRVMASPARYIALLRLIDLALMLGFEGRFRVIDNGRYQLEDKRTEIGRALRTILPPPPDELSGAWQGVVSKDRLRRYIPVWVVAVTGAAILAILYSVLQYGLIQSVDPVEKRLGSIAKTIN